jgi:hypothetical protein
LIKKRNINLLKKSVPCSFIGGFYTLIHGVFFLFVMGLHYPPAASTQSFAVHPDNPTLSINAKTYFIFAPSLIIVEITSM